MSLKNVLILYKKSAYTIYFQHPRSTFKKRAWLPKEIARFEKTHRKHFESLQIIENVLKRANIRYTKVCRGCKIDYSRFDFVVTVGGDGTFLEAARSIKAQPILGVNSDPSWSVGRFCSADSETFEKVFSKCLAGRIKIKKFTRIVLQVRGQKIEVLNDILVCHHNPAAMSRYYLSVNGRKEEQKSSGIWVSTAAGSSGGLKSAGGRQLPVLSDKFEYRPRELYKGRGNVDYKLRGAVVSSNARIEITSIMREGFVFVDGSHIFFPFDFGEVIRVSRSAHPLNVAWSR